MLTLYESRIWAFAGLGVCRIERLQDLRVFFFVFLAFFV